MPRNFGLPQRDWSKDEDHDANRAFRRFVVAVIGIVGSLLIVGAVAFTTWIASMTIAWPHDNGRYANDVLKPWFDSLASGKGLCCSFTDGRKIENAEWGTEDGHYWVVVDGQKITVPDEAIVHEPNRAGLAYVWPYKGDAGETLIRCFLKGTES